MAVRLNWFINVTHRRWGNVGFLYIRACILTVKLVCLVAEESKLFLV